MTVSIDALIEIMAGDSPIRRRLQAAETLLSFEAPAETVELAKLFLVKVIKSRGRVSTDTRLEAARLMRKAEAKKVIHQSIQSAETNEKREMLRDMVIGKRRIKLMRAGLWPAPKDWCDDLLGDYEPTVLAATGRRASTR